MAVWVAGILVLLLRQGTPDHKDGVALLPKRGQKRAQVEL